MGYGEDPLDAAGLRFVYEDGIRAVPSMCAVLAVPPSWLTQPEFGVDWVRMLHAEQAFEIHRPLASLAAVRGEQSVTAIVDKGPEKGALLYQQKILTDVQTGELLATVQSTLMLRGDGGLGGFGAPPPPLAPMPERAPDRTAIITTLPRQALIYRLSGDWNPLHADPDIARRAGFTRPILHGLCTKGIACRSVLREYCNDEPERLRAMSTRFSSPVFPGETLRIEFFENGHDLRFRMRAVERDVVVLDRGSFTLAVSTR